MRILITLFSLSCLRIQLLTVRRRLRLLCDLPDCDESLSSATATVTTLRSLFVHLRTTCLPFLRIAAFIMQEITAIDVPDAATLCQPSADKPVDEFILLLTYLGLPLGPEDLLTVLSAECAQSADLEESCSINLQTRDSSTSLYLARLITSWCLAGRSTDSRKLYTDLRQRFLSQLTEHPGPLPEPQMHVPRLISLPREYVKLLAIADVWKNQHSVRGTSLLPSLCLVCGAVASYFDPQVDLLSRLLNIDYSAPNSTEMEMHVRRNHAGYAFILLLDSSKLFCLSDEARRITKLPEVYRDEFGEPDVNLRRGSPLFLDEVAYRKLTGTWLKHEAIQTVS
ncbi:unnamed protein product [Dibothriocephalus latus]|uniref:E3 ubiquitin-protein ligase n=1 Tax=Dibothriocephalus latus TaxID=60516 RepID=A0A3P7LFF2_DIBLA|nr:unnamed protein product [Dibothriocephalus latus]